MNVIKNSIEYQGIKDMPPDLADPGCFRLFSLQRILSLPDVKPDMEKIIKVTAKTSIKKTKLVRAQEAVSAEGQILTGKKLIVNGELIIKIEYTPCNSPGAMYSSYFSLLFDTSIALLENIENEAEIIAVGYIQDISTELLDARTVLLSTTLLLVAQDI